MITVTRDDLSSAFVHLSEIASLHYKKGPDECFEAIEALEEYFGMDEEAREGMVLEVEEFVPESHEEARPWIIIGFLIGLSAANHGTDT